MYKKALKSSDGEVDEAGEGDDVGFAGFKAGP